MTAFRLSQPLAVSTATAQPAPAPTSAAHAALDDFARALPALPGSAPQALLARMDELRRETDEGLLLTELLALGIQLKSEHRAEAAYALLSRLNHDGIPEPVRAKARAEADAIEGKGAAGLRAEFLLSRFCKDATDARVIAPMIAATLVGQVAGTAALGRLMGRPASWLTRGFGAELGAGAFGYGAEVVTFAGLNRALAPHPNGPFSHDLARSALTIGALKLSGFAVNSALAGPGTRFVARGRASTLPFAAHQAGAFVGLTASHKLEEHWGLRPRVEGSTFLLDTFASLVSLGVGAHLGQRALGERFAEFRSELGMAAKLQKYRPQEKARALLSPAVAGGDGRGLPPILMMSMSMPPPGNPKGGGRRSQGTSWEQSQVPEVPEAPNGHISVTPADVVPRAPTEPPDPYIGTVFEGRYRINRKLGHGGMGVVYEAVHEIIGKKMALKLLRRDAMTKEMAERFLNEAKAASMIGNPHIIEITDFGKLGDGTPYFVMEYLEGTSLYGLIEGDRPVPVPRLVNIARQIAEGLADAHKAGIVHRDLKPENIFLITKGSKVDFVKILDFGIAKIANGGSKEKLTQAGVPFGTPQYMSPEQSAGQPTIDHRTDVYAFGMLLYEMATGRLPFNFENFQETLNAQMYVPPVPPSEMQPVKQPIPPGLEAIIMKAISKRPENRYQSMNEIIVELEKLQSGLVPVAVTELKNRSESADLPVDYFRTGLTPTNLRRSRRRWPIFAGIGGASVLAAAFYALSRTGGVTAQPTAVPPPDDKPKPDAAPVATGPTVTSLKRQVEVNVDPVDARVFRNGEDLGNNVVKVEMDPGQKVELEVKREGYKSRKITLDGLEESVTVKLEKEKAVRPRPSGNPSGSGKPKTKPTNSGEVISPWK